MIDSIKTKHIEQIQQSQDAEIRIIPQKLLMLSHITLLPEIIELVTNYFVQVNEELGIRILIQQIAEIKKTVGRCWYCEIAYCKLGPIFSVRSDLYVYSGQNMEKIYFDDIDEDLGIPPEDACNKLKLGVCYDIYYDKICLGPSENIQFLDDILHAGVKLLCDECLSSDMFQK